MRGVYPLSGRKFHRWKNGRGETAEILVFPADAGFDDFDWRISTAIVAFDGPFSTFPGVDRMLTVIEGGPMWLTVAGQEYRIDSASPPLSFPGDTACEARLEGKAVLNFNVMLRRPFRAKVIRGPLEPVQDAARARLALLLENRAGLSRLDLVDLDRADPDLVVALSEGMAISVVIFD